MTERELQRRIQDLEAEIADLRRALGNVPVRFGAGGSGDELPRPRRRYDLLQCIDDAETVAFDLPKFAAR